VYKRDYAFRVNAVEEAGTVDPHLTNNIYSTWYNWEQLIHMPFALLIQATFAIIMHIIQNRFWNAKLTS